MSDGRVGCLAYIVGGLSFIPLIGVFFGGRREWIRCLCGNDKVITHRMNLWANYLELKDKRDW